MKCLRVTNLLFWAISGDQRFPAFDRLLLAQAMEEDCVLLTHDTVLPAYGAPVQHV